ncbi:DUF930 domain-containing protein [Mesorhizobium sp. B2-2-3]|uniref:DUF930 domain-containing protein n=1 Tax=Mesorhizobium sp. B2-2-3 TaxID=2589963 RepID=UPI00112BDE02|nr:DUF930 domain-containing protein [Mesorhizobium sp. B2-2-3]TPM41327.1 DUF930 domain-containing protein [Mesorhizobium sp. B2-2-3]
MKDEARERRRDLLWALPASLILHALLAALVFYNLPRPAQEPQQDQPVNVALVPPPDQPKPKPAPAPPKEPKAEKPPETKPEEPPEKQSRKTPPIETLRPVFQFGDKDAGPRKSLDGASAQDSSPAPAKEETSKPPVTPEPAETKSGAPAATEKPAELPEAGEKPATAAKDAESLKDAEEAETPDADKQTAAAPPLAADDGDTEVELPISAEKPTPKPANAPKPGSSKVSKSSNGSAGSPTSPDVASAASRRYSGLPGVRKLYSQDATGDALATTSMGGVPRAQRGAKLCASALQQQLLDASYFPDLIPSVPLKAGNILNAPDVAFRATGTWYHLGFRCEVDSDVTRVLSFGLRVGSVIPPDEWVRLGLPTR